MKPPLTLAWPPPDKRVRIEVREDNMLEVLEQTIEALKRLKPEICRGNGHLVRTYQNDGEPVITRVKTAWLKPHVQEVIRFVKWDEPINPPSWLYKHVMASFTEFPFYRSTVPMPPAKTVSMAVESDVERRERAKKAFIEAVAEWRRAPVGSQAEDVASAKLTASGLQFLRVSRQATQAAGLSAAT